MSMRELSSRLKQWRCERADEWTMDTFISLALALEHKSETQSDEIDRLRAELTEARRMIDAKYAKIAVPTHAMEQSFQWHYKKGFESGKKAAPVPAQPAVGVTSVISAYECGMQSTDHINQFAHGTAEHEAFVHGVNHRYALDHLVAQTHPSAVPEAVAKDAARLQFMIDEGACVVTWSRPDGEVLHWLSWPQHESEQHGSFASARESIDSAMKDTAILSAADDEVKK